MHEDLVQSSVKCISTFPGCDFFGHKCQVQLKVFIGHTSNVGVC